MKKYTLTPCRTLCSSEMKRVKKNELLPLLRPRQASAGRRKCMSKKFSLHHCQDSMRHLLLNLAIFSHVCDVPSDLSRARLRRKTRGSKKTEDLRSSKEVHLQRLNTFRSKRAKGGGPSKGLNRSGKQTTHTAEVLHTLCQHTFFTYVSCFLSTRNVMKIVFLLNLHVLSS